MAKFLDLEGLTLFKNKLDTALEAKYIQQGTKVSEAETADKLATAVTINGVSFDGSQNITVADDTKIPLTQKGAADGVASLDSSGKVPSEQLPSYVDDVLSYESQSAFPEEGESGKIYLAEDTNLIYRWAAASGGEGGSYIEVSANAGTSDAAVKLATARSFSITGGATAAAVSFDGTADVALNVTSLDATTLTGTVPDSCLDIGAIDDSDIEALFD